MKKKRTEQQIQEDRREVYELFLQGWSKREIAEKLRLSDFQVANDLRACLAMVAEETKEVITDYTVHALAKLDFLERKAWEAYYRSGEDATINNTRIISETNPETGRRIEVSRAEVTRIETRVPASSYLNVIESIHKDRHRLLGLLHHERQEFTPEQFVKAIHDFQQVINDGGIEPPKEQVH